MKSSVHVVVSFLTLCMTLSSLSGAERKANLEVVAEFPEQQVTGVAVAKDGRVFVNFPFWDDQHTISVAELRNDGTLKPFPDATWNTKEGDPATRWVCVQSVYVDDAGALWVLDPAAPKLGSIVKGGPKLVKFDLATNQIVQTIAFPESITPDKAYLNDVRVDNSTGHAYITESGTGALVLVDLKSGKSRRVLANHESTKAEPAVELVVDGLKPKDPKTGKTPQFNADGIALDASKGWLYWHPLTGHTLWRAKLEDLRNEQLSEEKLSAKVERVAETVAPDGMIEGRNGSIYLTAIEKDGIVRFDPESKQSTTVIEDKLLQWPDTLSWGADAWLYVTTSQIHRTARMNGGVDKREGQPFRVLRVRVE